MTFSYTQISQYLACPRRYKYRYRDGWLEKPTRASMLFGRAFEQALGAFFRREDSATALFQEWSAYRGLELDYTHGDTWDRMLQKGIQLLERLAQDDRVCIRQPQHHLQIKFVRQLSSTNDFVAYVDAIGQVDGVRCLIEWKTTSCRYPDEPAGLLALDPQLVCYSWITGLVDVAMVVFVRKRLLEIQYLRTRISDQQREEFGQLVAQSVQNIEAGAFLPHSGIRFPQNQCLNCSCLGLCLGRQDLINQKLIRRPGEGDLGWLDQLDF